jgi:uncharacterized protein YdeI (YjbR/CyaY-like superfamily)
MAKKKKVSPKPVAKSFRATLERPPSIWSTAREWPNKFGWTILRIPFSVHKVWGVRGSVRVKGELNGFAFRTSLFPTQNGRHFLIVNKQIQQGAQAFPGTTAHCRLEPDTAARAALLPAELQRALREDRSLRAWFDRLSHSMRRWFGNWVAQPKSAASRVRRAEQVAEQLLSVMEAEGRSGKDTRPEEALPPALRLAFSRDPRALEGWRQMSPARRRGELLSIFHYRTPDARARRIDRAVEDAIAFAQRKSR